MSAAMRIALEGPGGGRVRTHKKHNIVKTENETSDEIAMPFLVPANVQAQSRPLPPGISDKCASCAKYLSGGCASPEIDGKAGACGDIPVLPRELMW